MKEYRIIAIENELNESPVKIIHAESAEKFFRDKWGFDLQVQEACYAIFLDKANHIKGYTLVSLGGITGTVIDTRIILKFAIDLLATGLILAHNHPSGQTRPSDQDIRITKKINEACKLIELTLLDHIILTEKEVYSMANNGDI